jgi:hypothetical protein
MSIKKKLRKGVSMLNVTNDPFKRVHFPRIFEQTLPKRAVFVWLSTRALAIFRLPIASEKH